MKPGMGLIGRKLGMTQIFQEDGQPVPVTVLEAGPCTVVAERTEGAHGYRAVQLGFGESRPKGLSKPLAGYFAKAKTAPKEVLKEFRIGKEEPVTLGGSITVDLFKAGDRVDVTGRSIGKGFQGGMKRWHWKGGPRTHGSTSHRRPGSIGSSTDPSRVFKGHHLPGHMGDRTVTVQALSVVRVDPERNLLLVEGAVPGAEQAVVFIRRSRKPPKVAGPKRVAKKKAAPQAAKPATGKKPAAAKQAPAAPKKG